MVSEAQEVGEDRGDYVAVEKAKGGSHPYVDDILAADQWMAPGRKILEGFLMVSPGSRRRRLGLLDSVLADIVEEATGRQLPRWPDAHTVWFGFDSAREPGDQYVRPFLRYKASRPIAGLGRDHHGHRVRLTCTIGHGANWRNGLGAYITRATGVCLDCPQEHKSDPPSPASGSNQPPQ